MVVPTRGGAPKRKRQEEGDEEETKIGLADFKPKDCDIDVVATALKRERFDIKGDIENATDITSMEGKAKKCEKLGYKETVAIAFLEEHPAYKNLQETVFGKKTKL
eukprot:449407-Amphidinium_carterae.1